MSRNRKLLLGASVAWLAMGGITALVVSGSPSLAGTWVNESQIFNAPPGDLRIQVNSEGTGLLFVDQNWVYDGFEYRVTRGHVIVRLGLREQVQSKGELTFAYFMQNRILTLSPADGETQRVFPSHIDLRKVADSGSTLRLHAGSD